MARHLAAAAFVEFAQINDIVPHDVDNLSQGPGQCDSTICYGKPLINLEWTLAMADAPEAAEIIRALGLAPHPEGGHYRETFRDTATLVAHDAARGASTAIYYLLQAGEVSHWHRVDAAEVWHWYAGAPLVLTLSENGHDAASRVLGPELAVGQRPQLVVPADVWQTAESLGAWTLCGCTVAPAFRFEGFEMAPPDWRPTPRSPQRR